LMLLVDDDLARSVVTGIDVRATSVRGCALCASATDSFGAASNPLKATQQAKRRE
jgi:hypothetical protein